MHYEEDNCYEPSEFEIKVNELIKNEVDNRVEEVYSELSNTKERLKTTTEKFAVIQHENNKLQKVVDKQESFINFKKLINKDNFTSFINSLGLKKNTFTYNGMNTKEIPSWFHLLFCYYEDKKALFSLMDLFDIECPTWAKQYKMPYEYSKEELKLFINPQYNRYITNGEIFNNNIGFFWESVHRNNGDTFKILTGNYAYIPWQLVLSNKLWLEDDMFDLIINAVSKNQRDCCYYFKIQDYLKLSKAQINKLADCLPLKDLYDVHKWFLEKNPQVLKTNDKLVQAYKKSINDNHYSAFYYLNFPTDIQLEFVKKYKSGFETKTSLIQKMTLSKEEKVKLLMEV